MSSKKRKNASVSFTLASILLIRSIRFCRLTQRSQQQSGDCVLQSVRHHRRPQTLSQQAHDSEGNPEQSDQHHALRPFVSVAEAEKDAHHDQRDPAVARAIA